MKVTKMYDNKNINWEDDKNWNELFLRSMFNYLQLELQTSGLVSLNEVYQRLGYPKTRDGCLLGWNVTDGDNEIRVDIKPIDGTSDFLITFDATLLFEPGRV